MHSKSNLGRLLGFFLALGPLFFSMAFADSFHLESGVVIEGDLINDDGKYYTIAIPVGTTRILISSVQKRVESSSPVTNMDAMNPAASKINDIDHWLKMADHMLKKERYAKAFSCLQRVEALLEKPDPELTQRLIDLEVKVMRETELRAEEKMKVQNFREGAAVIIRALKLMRDPENIEKLRKIKKVCYAQLLDPYASLEALRRDLKNFESYPVNNMKKLTASGRSGKWHAPDIVQDDLVKFQKLANRVDPGFSGILDSIVNLYKIRLAHIEGEITQTAFLPLVDAAQLTALRANPSAFSEARTRNNEIYQARGQCSQFNSLLYQVHQRFKQSKDAQSQERLRWRVKGYQQVEGEWLTPLEAKKAKGWILYYDEWLDPASSDFEDQRAALDLKFNPPEILVEEGEETVPETKVDNPAGETDETSPPVSEEPPPADSPAEVTPKPATPVASKAPPSKPRKKSLMKQFQESSASTWLGGIVLIGAILALRKGKKKK